MAMASLTALMPQGIFPSSAMAASYSSRGSVQNPSDMRMQTGGSPRRACARWKVHRQGAGGLLRLQSGRWSPVPGQTNSFKGTGSGPTSHDALLENFIALIRISTCGYPATAFWTSGSASRMAWLSVAIFFPRIESEQSASQKKCNCLRATCPSGIGIASSIKTPPLSLKYTIYLSTI